MLKFNGTVVFCAGLALVVGVEGCQRGPTWQLTAVEGIVSRKGQPLEGVEVVFWPDVGAGAEGPRALGFTDAAGHYELRTDAGDRGAAVGRYRVSLLAHRRSVPDREADRSGATPVERQEAGVDKPSVSDVAQAPLNYRTAAKTPLQVEVRSGGSQTVDFDVLDVPPTRKVGKH